MPPENNQSSINVGNVGNVGHVSNAVNAGRGYALAASAAVLWGLSGTASKYLLSHQVRPSDLLAIRTAIAATLIFIWLALTSPRLLRVSRADLPYFLILGVVGLAAHQFLYYLALERTSVGFALLLAYTAPIFLMAYGLLAKTERMTPGKALAALTAISGCVLMVFGQAGGIGSASLSGAAFAIASAILFAFYSVYSQRGLRRYDARTMLAYIFLASSIGWLVFRPPWTWPVRSYDPTIWSVLLYLSSVVTLLPFGMYLASLRHIEASRANLTSMIEPVMATALAWLWLGEQMQPMQIAGGAAVLCGVLLLQIESLMLARRITERIQQPIDRHDPP